MTYLFHGEQKGEINLKELKKILKKCMAYYDNE